MDTTRLEEHIANAMFAGNVNGRLQRVASLARKNRIAMAEGDSTPFLVDPQTFTAAKRWLDQKAIMPTELSSADISLNVPAGERMQAFFSAKVSSANILTSFKDQVDRIAAGEIGYGEAKKKMTEFLAREGYGIPQPGTKEDRAITDITSTARMELVLRQNVNMANSIGQRAVSENEFVMERYPNYRYISNTDRHAEFDGLVLPKTDPFWETHYPPWEFNCQCMAVDEDADPNAQTAGFKTSPDGGQSGRMDFNGRMLDVEPAPSGFVFQSDPAKAFLDPAPDIIDDPGLRAIFKDLLAKRKAQPKAP